MFNPALLDQGEAQEFLRFLGFFCDIFFLIGKIYYFNGDQKQIK